jgi:hypothetical protein
MSSRLYTSSQTQQEPMRYFHYKARDANGREYYGFFQTNGGDEDVAALATEHAGLTEITEEESKQLLAQQHRQTEQDNGYAIEHTADNRCQVVFVRERPHCHALHAASFQEETMLHRGLWLVVLFYAWSVPDMKGFGMAMKAIEEFKGKIQLGILPFEYSMWQWHPAVNGLYGSPVSMLFKDGEFIEMKSHLLNEEELLQWLRGFAGDGA